MHPLLAREPAPDGLLALLAREPAPDGLLALRFCLAIPVADTLSLLAHLGSSFEKKHSKLDREIFN